MSPAQCIVMAVELESDGTDTQTSDVPPSSHVSTSKGSRLYPSSVNQRCDALGQAAYENPSIAVGEIRNRIGKFSSAVAGAAGNVSSDEHTSAVMSGAQRNWSS